MSPIERYNLDRSRKPNMWLKFDYILLITVVGLSIMGLIMLPSLLIGYKDQSRTYIMQIICFVLGIGIAIVISCIDYNVFKHMAIFFYIANIFMMLLVYTPLGVENFGSRNWINIGISYQPSELMKLATIIMVAICLEDMKNDKGRRMYNIFRIGFFFGVPMILVLLQKDLGTALVFVFYFFIMIFIAGLKYRYIFGVIAAAAVAFPFVWKFYLSKDPTRSARILSFFSSDPDIMGSGYQAYQAKLAIGSGQLNGAGIGNGVINNAFDLPVKVSDFAFSIICEELGFIGAIIIIMLFMILLFRMIGISRKSSDYFGEYVSIGIFSMFAFHFWENIGMNIGIMPITGIPLPFISAGGSAMITNFISIGVLLSISARRRSEGLFGEMD